MLEGPQSWHCIHSRDLAPVGGVRVRGGGSRGSQAGDGAGLETGNSLRSWAVCSPLTALEAGGHGRVEVAGSLPLEQSRQPPPFPPF